MVTDTNEEFLFAAGQDRRVRMWSLRTGEHLSPTETGEGRHFLSTEFEQPIIGLHCSQNGESGRGLYVVLEDRIHHFT